MRSIYNKWLDSYELAYDEPAAVNRIACPSCGQLCLNLLFIVESGADVRGTSAYWCGVCLRGLPPNRTLIPQGGLVVERGNEIVPNYTLVIDDGREG